VLKNHTYWSKDYTLNKQYWQTCRYSGTKTNLYNSGSNTEFQ